MFERAVIGTLGVIRESASGQFPAFYMVLQTIAAETFARAGFIATIAVFQVFFLFAVHSLFPLLALFQGLYEKIANGQNTIKIWKYNDFPRAIFN
jgi:hypothetical protein